MARHKEFSKEEALQNAMLVFWQKGYEATSIENLTTATGLSRSSLYGTFGNKEQLFAEVLALYANMRANGRQDLLMRMVPPKEMIQLLFNQLIEQLADESSPDGCLLTETATNLNGVNQQIGEFVQQRIEELYDLYLNLIEVGQADGSITRERTSAELAGLLLNLHEGVIVLSGVNRQPKEQKQLIISFLDML